LYELLSAYDPIVVLVDLFEDALDALLGVCFIFKEKCYLVVRYLSGMIDVKVGESLLEVIFSEKILYFKASYYKLSQIDKARIICVDDSHHKIHP
jgi:hypothetical protein